MLPHIDERNSSYLKADKRVYPGLSDQGPELRFRSPKFHVPSW